MSNPGFFIVAVFLFVMGFFGFGASFGAMNDLGVLISLAAGSTLWGLSFFLLAICRRQFKVERAHERGMPRPRKPRGGFGKGALMGLVATVVLAVLAHHVARPMLARGVMVGAVIPLAVVGGLMVSMWRATELPRAWGGKA